MNIKIIKKMVSTILVAVILGGIAYSTTFAFSKPQELSTRGACTWGGCDCIKYTQRYNSTVFCVCGHAYYNHKME